MWAIVSDQDAFLVASNVFFLLPAALCLWWWRNPYFTFGLHMLFTALNSTAFHACNSYARLCFIDAMALKKLDYFTAQLTIPFIALILIVKKRRVFTEIAILLWIAMAVTIPFVHNLDILQIFVVVPTVIALAWHWRRGLPHYEPVSFALGVSVTLLAVTLFMSEMPSIVFYDRWVTHSLWHCWGPIAITLFLVAARY